MTSGYDDTEPSDFDDATTHNNRNHDYTKSYIFSLIDSLNTQIRENQSKIFGAVEPIFEYASKMLILEMQPYIDLIKKIYFLIFFMFSIILVLIVYLLHQVRLLRKLQ
jgi:hypothetical protein